MNKIYRVVWNAEAGQWVVASEIARGRKKSAASRSTASSLMVAAVAVGAMGGSSSTMAASGNGAYLDLCSWTGAGTMYAAGGTAGLGCGSNYFDLGVPGSAAGISGSNSGNLTVYASRSVTLGNETSLTGHKIISLAEGTSGTDAVNLNQLKAVEAKIGAGGTDPNAVHYDTGTSRTKVTLAGSGGTIISNVKDGNVVSGSKEAVNGGQLFTTNQNVTNLQNNYNTLNTRVGALDDNALKWNGATYNAARQGANRTIDGLSNGTVSATSSDAINGSQLYGTTKSVTDALGAGAGVNTDGTIKAPGYTIAGKTYNDVGSALGAIETDVAPKLKYIKFGYTTALDASASGTDSVAIGGASTATGTGALAIGNGARAMADNSVAIGVGSATAKWAW